VNWKRLLLVCSLVVSTAVLAVEDPPNCALVHGGLGNTSQGGINFTFSRAHVGDTVPVFPAFGMSVGACGAINVTGTVYIATGPLTNFLQNVTLSPDGAHFCPTGALCEPGPYNMLITAPMVGAGVSSPNGSLSGTAKSVKVVENAFGDVTVGVINDQLADFHSATIAIVTPCIEVFKTCGVSCALGANFTGYVTNCGDVTLTNIMVVDDRTASLFNLDGSALSQPLTLTNGQVANFMGSWVPSGAETSTATNTITVTGTDTTTIGGPNASVTNSVTAICTITPCTACQCPCLFVHRPTRGEQYALATRSKFFNQ
jgi:hypothetical protein